MGPNTLTIVKKAIIGKQTKIYNPGELVRVDLIYIKSNIYRKKN